MPNGETDCTTPFIHFEDATPARAPTSTRFSNAMERTSFFPSEENSSIWTLMFVPALRNIGGVDVLEAEGGGDARQSG